ncbi:hypothetical protein MMC16_005019 [Acarospora aff. strigata]|nr:hypothetical protein [Acarospora aff. strigata]
MTSPLRIGYVPEHFSTPLHFAQKYFGLDATLIPYPSGTGHMITSLQAKEIDVGIGLTEGWVAGLGKDGEKAGYKIVGTYVETPLCWAISTGAKRDIDNVLELKDSKIGVSRIGSGSYVMGFVLADTKGWLKTPGEPPFGVIPLQTFARLRDAVNDGTADFFMWEYFTSKKYYDNGEIKQIGDIYTPWSSWKIVAADPTDARLREMFSRIDKGVEYFNAHPEEAVEYISASLDYSADDARAWLGTVKFADGVEGVSEDMIEKTIDSLRKAGVIVEKDIRADAMIGVKRK